VLSHHDQQASDDQNQTQHGRMLPSSMLLLNLILLIEVTFSTPTGDFTSVRRLFAFFAVSECNGDFSTVIGYALIYIVV
jgi:hypothetical protein